MRFDLLSPKLTIAAALTAGCCALTACGGSSTKAASTPTAAASSSAASSTASPTKDTASATTGSTPRGAAPAYTNQGSTFALGRKAIVPFTYGKSSATIGLTATKIVVGVPGDLTPLKLGATAGHQGHRRAVHRWAEQAHDTQHGIRH